MANTPVKIKTAIGVTATTLYDPFSGGGSTVGVLISLDLCNTTTSDITVDIYIESGATDVYIADDLLVPAKGNACWRGAIPVDTGTEVITAIASAVGLDATGCVMES